MISSRIKHLYLSRSVEFLRPPIPLIHQNGLQLLEVEVGTIGHARVAIIVLAVHAEVNELLALSDLSTGATLYGVDILSCNHHVLLLVLAGRLELVQAVELAAGTELLLLTLVHHHLLGEVLNDLHFVGIELLDVEVPKTLVIGKVATAELLAADLALNHYLWTLALDVLSQLAASQVLELRQVADVAAVLWALVHLDVLLQFVDGHPFHFTGWISLSASMRKLTEFNNVADNGVDFCEEVSFAIAVGTSLLAERQLVRNLHLLLLIALAAKTSLSRVRLISTSASVYHGDAIAMLW